MKTISFLIFLAFSISVHSQTITGKELKAMAKDAQEQSIGAHESIVIRANEEFGKAIWGKTVRINDAKIVKFFKRSSGEKVSAGVDVHSSKGKAWAYEYDQKTASDLLTKNGVRITTSYNTLWIKANQDLLYAENTIDGKKTVLELYCPQQSFFETLRIGKNQSIEFLITGYKGSTASTTRIYGVLTAVHADKQVIKCANGHEFDKDAGYKFCPTCGEPLE
jgi:hypothetical protein